MAYLGQLSADMAGGSAEATDQVGRYLMVSAHFWPDRVSLSNSTVTQRRGSSSGADLRDAHDIGCSLRCSRLPAPQISSLFND